MRAFISYVDDDDVSTAFAHWLYDALKRPESPVNPWIDFIDLPAVGTFDRRLPTAVNSCNLFLFVWAPFTPDSNVCMDELRYARHFGKPILTLRIAKQIEWHPLVGDYPTVEFAEDRERGLSILFERIERLNRPEGQIAQLEERLRHARNELRRSKPGEQLASSHEVDLLEDRLKELLADAQVSNDDQAASRVTVVAQGAAPSSIQQANFEILRKAYTGDVPVILVTGPEGAGKTRLVKGILQKYGVDSSRNLITTYHQAHGPQSFTAEDLADLLENALQRHSPETYAQWQRSSEVATTRKLDTLLGLLGSTRTVVILDSGEALLDDGTGRLASTELEDALELLTTHTGSAVKILLVTREQPHARNRKWLNRAFKLSLDRGPSLAEFKELLREMDIEDVYGLSDPDEGALRVVYEHTGGRPRAAELVHGILACANVPESEHSFLVSLADIANALNGVDQDDALNFLTGRLIDGLDSATKRTLQALSAFGVPVDAEAVAYMLPGENKEQIERRLRNLRTLHLVRQADGRRYFVHPPDNSRALESVRTISVEDELDRRSLMLRAASYFALKRKAEVNRLDDLSAELSEIDLLLQVGEYEAAFRVMEGVDNYLDNWGCRWVLRRRREHLRGILRDDLSEIANLQALGDIALQADDLSTAESFYREGASYLEGHYWPDIRNMLFVSLGGVLQRRDEMQRALVYYRDAHAIAREHDESDAEVVPLAGMADCFRHWGEFDKAIECLERSTELARTGLSLLPLAEGQRRLASVLLKLGMRYAELGDHNGAQAAIVEASELASTVESWAAKCQCLDALATLKLWQGDRAEALELAKAALELASRVGRRPLQRQVLTTSAVCYLFAHDFTNALEDIRAATRGRPPGRSLITLGLRGLSEHRAGNLWPAQRLFKQLRHEAAERVRKDARDFGALDMEGFALCGQHIGRSAPPLAPAIDAFRAARKLTRAAGITKQLVRLLTLLDESKLGPAIIAAGGEPVAS